MDAYETRAEYGVSSVAAAERVSTFLRAVYGWMFVGLGVTAVVAFGVAGSPRIVQALVSNRLLFFALIGGELGLVFYLVGARGPTGAGHGVGAVPRLFGAQRRDAVADPAGLHGRVGRQHLRACAR